MLDYDDWKQMNSPARVAEHLAVGRPVFVARMTNEGKVRTCEVRSPAAIKREQSIARLDGKPCSPPFIAVDATEAKLSALDWIRQFVLLRPRRTLVDCAYPKAGYCPNCFLHPCGAECPECHGRGEVPDRTADAAVFVDPVLAICFACDGYGRKVDRRQI